MAQPIIWLTGVTLTVLILEAWFYCGYLCLDELTRKQTRASSETNERERGWQSEVYSMCVREIELIRGRNHSVWCLVLLPKFHHSTSTGLNVLWCLCCWACSIYCRTVMINSLCVLISTFCIFVGFLGVINHVAERFSLVTQSFWKSRWSSWLQDEDNK